MRDWWDVCYKISTCAILCKEVLSCVITAWVIRWFQRSRARSQPLLSCFSLAAFVLLFFLDRCSCPCILSLPVRANLLDMSLRTNYSSCPTFSEVTRTRLVHVIWHLSFKMNLSFGIHLYDRVGTNYIYQSNAVFHVCTRSNSFICC